MLDNNCNITYVTFKGKKKPIVHKDLKPDNIGIDKNDDILLSDFGCTSMFSESSDCRYQYPLQLRPPELAYDEEYWKKYYAWITKIEHIGTVEFEENK